MQRRIEIHTTNDFSEEDVIKAMGRTVLEDAEPALPGPVFAIELDDDDRVRVDHMRPERSSLELLGARRLAIAVNRLDRLDLARVACGIRKRLSASHESWAVLRRILPDERLTEALDGCGDDGTLGGMRLDLVQRYCGTWNGQGDTWLLWAAEHVGTNPESDDPGHEQLALGFGGQP